MPASYIDELSVFGANLDFLDAVKPPTKGTWFTIASATIDDERNLLKLAISETVGKRTTDIVILFDNITFVYRPDGVPVDKYVHPGAMASLLISSNTNNNNNNNSSNTQQQQSPTQQQQQQQSPLQPNIDPWCVFGLRVAGGTRANQTGQAVNHLGTFIADVAVIFQSKSADVTDRFIQTLVPCLNNLHDPTVPRPNIVYDPPPASSPSFFKTFARTLVSRAKRRFTDGNFNLDLAYITSNLIAMGYPTPPSETEAIYRNDMGDVFRFFSTNHRDKYWVINLCSERAFPPSSFNGRFSRLPFEDHEAPPIRLLFDFCQSIEMFLATGRPMVASMDSCSLAPFLTADERAAFWRKCPPGPSDDLPGANGRVVAVHCKAGKGRTGVSLSAWVYYERLMRALYAPGVSRNAVVPPDVEACASLFGERRSNDGSGVTIVSQMRLLRYFSRCCFELGMSLPSTIRPVRVKSVSVNMTPALDAKGGSRLFVIVRTLRAPQIWERMGRREWLGRGMKMSAVPVTKGRSVAPMTPLDPVTLATVADSRKIASGGGGAAAAAAAAAPEWVIAGSRITIPLGDVEVEDEFHVSVWHAASPGDGSDAARAKKKVMEKTDDDDDEPSDTAPSSPQSPVARAGTMQHGGKGEFMACACWLHSSFVEVGDSSSAAGSSNDADGGSGGAGALPHTSVISLGLRQLDGCSKGKTIDLFEENFTVDIELEGCRPRPRRANG